MDQQQNSLISLIAVFLALGIGILIGASMGENALVTNQIAVIEELNNEIRRHKEEVEAQFLSVAQLKEELLGWESLEKEYLNSLLIQDKLKNVAVKIIVQDSLPADLADFLELSGCSYQAFIFAEMNSWSELLSGRDEDVLLLGTNSSLLINDLLELILLGEENSLVEDILNKLAEKNLLWIQTEQTVTSSSPSPFAVEGQNYDREYFIAYGPLDPLCLELLHKIGQKGKTVLRVNAPENHQNTSMELNTAVAEKLTLNNFCGKLKLLEFLQAVY